MRPHADQGDRARTSVVRGACRGTRPIAAGIGRARWYHAALCPAPRRPRLSQPRAGRRDPARPATGRTHRDTSHRTRSAARLDRPTQPAGEPLKSDPRYSVSRPRPGIFSLSVLVSGKGGTASMPVREKQPERAGSRPVVPVSGLVQAHSPAESGVFAPVGMEGTSETDWLPEEDGFEPSVPPEKRTHLVEMFGRSSTSLPRGTEG